MHPKNYLVQLICMIYRDIPILLLELVKILERKWSRLCNSIINSNADAKCQQKVLLFDYAIACAGFGPHDRVTKLFPQIAPFTIFWQLFPMRNKIKTSVHGIMFQTIQPYNIKLHANYIANRQIKNNILFVLTKAYRILLRI